MEKRAIIINQMIDRTNQLRVEVKMTISGQTASNGTWTNSINRDEEVKNRRGEDGEYDSTRDLSGRQVLDN
jgi:hypothetical protein